MNKEHNMSEDTTMPETTPEAPKISFGFAILVDENSNVYIERDTQVFSIPVEREASLIEVRRYISEILMDLQAQAAAEYTAIRLSHPKQPGTPADK